MPAGKLTALLAGTSGLRTAELAKATEGDPAQVLSLLKDQEAPERSGAPARAPQHAGT